MEHFQCFAEIVNDVLVMRIGALHNDSHIVVGILIANATEKNGELVGVVVLLKPALEEQAAFTLTAIAGVADIEYNGSVDTEKLNKYRHDGLLDFRVTLSADVAHVVDIELVGVTATNGRVLLQFNLVEHVAICFKQVDTVCHLLNRVRAGGLNARNVKLVHRTYKRILAKGYG